MRLNETHVRHPDVIFDDACIRVKGKPLFREGGGRHILIGIRKGIAFRNMDAQKPAAVLEKLLHIERKYPCDPC